MFAVSLICEEVGLESLKSKRKVTSEQMKPTETYFIFPKSWF